MFNTSLKPTTARRATATAALRAGTETLDRLRQGTVPKGNVLETARTAAILAAKRTPEVIPLCHPIPIDQVTVEFDVGTDAVSITASVLATWKTGVEMEALVAATTAALVVYDMLKPLDANMEIGAVRVVEKRGGKGDFVDAFDEPLRVAVVVSSDGTAAGTREDRSGKLIVETLRSAPVHVESYTIVPDDRQTIEQTLLRLCDEQHCDLVLTTGGTGLGPRDVTVEATQAILDTVVPGIMEAARDFGQGRNPYAMLSRGCAGLRGRTLIVNLPGSTNGVRESLAALLPGLFHAFKMMRGGGHGG